MNERGLSAEEIQETQDGLKDDSEHSDSEDEADSNENMCFESLPFKETYDKPRHNDYPKKYSWRLFLLKENGTGTFTAPKKIYGADNLRKYNYSIVSRM